MSTHVITAGHGYTYLTRHTMAGDGLGAYYSERGEAPGSWLGRGLAGLELEAGRVVREPEMIALFGEGRHPLADEITARLLAEGLGAAAAAAATELGRPFALNLANSGYARQVAQLAAEWNRVHDQPVSATVPAPVAAWIRTAVGQTMFAEQHGRDADPRELADFVAQQSRRGSKAVAGFDLTFSPVKSVSALWALAPDAAAAQIEAAHHAAVADTMAWLERNAAFTRLGRNGVRQVETRGLIAAAFVHRASRAGDPDLHTHVAVSNKVQTLDGRWRALDGRVLFKATVTASERYNTRLEAELRERLGVEFVEHARPGRRPVREIAGVDERLVAAWSKRRAVLEARRGELTAAFQAEHGRPPTPVEAIALAQQATLETRGAKPAPQSLVEQRTAWCAEATNLLGEPAIAVMLDQALGRRREAGKEIDVDELAVQVIERVESDRATWQRWHIEAEAQRVLRRAGVPLPELDGVLARTVDTALAAYSVALTRPDPIDVPEPLRRADGSSVYAVAG